MFAKISGMHAVAGLLGLALLATPLAAKADPIPAGWNAKGVKPVGYLDLGGEFPLKIAITQAKNRWYLFTGLRAIVGEGTRGRLLVIDITDPTQPRLIKTIEAPADTDLGQVSVHGNLLVTNLTRLNSVDAMSGRTESVPAFQKAQGPDGPPEGATFWDISDPTDPKPLAEWRTGARSGTHRNAYSGGRYAFMAASKAGFQNYILRILDVSDPAHPAVAGEWWQQGQKEGEVQPEGRQMGGFHGPAFVNKDGTMLTLGYTPDLINLDISDIAHPKLIGRLTLTPPFVYNGVQSVHTGQPLNERGLVYVSGEAMRPNCNEALPLNALVDNSQPKTPRLVAIMPLPAPPPGAKYHNFCEIPGRFGPHNISSETHNPLIAPIRDELYVAYFNAGLQIYNISDARQPRISGYFLPADSTRPGLSQSGRLKNYIAEDVAQDIRGNTFMIGSGGLYVLRANAGAK